MSWMHYLLEGNLYLILFYALYYLVLRRETWHQYNRAYLLGSSALAFIIPVIQLGFLKPLPAAELPRQLVTQYSYVAIVKANPIAQPGWNGDDILLAVYLLIVCCLMVGLAVKITKLLLLSRKAPARDFGKWKTIKTDTAHGAFSFFNYLFLSADMASSDIVVAHELVHIRQKHSWDVIYLEIFRIVNWFNPISYLLQRSMKELHEFIADEAITGSKEQIDTYTDFLVANAYGTYEHQLTNNLFNQSLLKKRIMMLHQKRSGNTAKLKYLLGLPLLSGLLCASTLAFAKDYGWVDIAPRKTLNESSKTVNHKTGQLAVLPAGAKENKRDDKIPLLSKGSPGFIIDPSTCNFETLTWMASKFHKKGYTMDFDKYRDDEHNPMLKLSLRKNDSKPNSGVSATFKIDELIKHERVIFIDADPSKNTMQVLSHKFVLLMHQKSSKKTDSTIRGKISTTINKQVDSIVAQNNNKIKGEIKAKIDQQIQKVSNRLPPPASMAPEFESLRAYLATSLHYPQSEFAKKGTGNVIVQFTTSTDHKITNVKVQISTGKVYSDAVIKTMKAYTGSTDKAAGTYILALQFNIIYPKRMDAILPFPISKSTFENPNFIGLLQISATAK
jgi:hypothetical protein